MGCTVGADEVEVACLGSRTAAAAMAGRSPARTKMESCMTLKLCGRCEMYAKNMYDETG